MATTTTHANGLVGGSRHYGTVRLLWVLAAVGIIYGSLYPFAFEWAAITPERVMEILLERWRGKLSPINILMNVLLFVPYGLFAGVALAGRGVVVRWLLVFATAAVLAFGVQLVQVWLPARVPTFVDGFINLVGVFVGMLLALVPRAIAMLTERGPSSGQMRALPLLLMFCWLAYRWFPFVPSLDVASLKDGLRPLLQPELRPLDLLHNLAAWLVFAYLWSRCGWRDLWLWMVIPLAVIAQAGVADNVLTLHNLLAAVVAPGLWMAINRLAQRPVEPVVVILIAVLIIQGLRPFETGSAPFAWVPFKGFLGGSMFVNMASLLEKVFLYGGLIWLVLEAGQSRVTGLLLPVLLVAGLEAAQMQIATRFLEITDAVLCLILWAVAMVGWRSAADVRRESDARATPV